MTTQQQIPLGWIKGRDALLDQIRGSFAGPRAQSVNFSVPKHTAIVLALHSLVFDGTGKERWLPIVFNDGSQPVDFYIPGYTQKSKPSPAGGRTFRVGLMSMRHPELDYLVDMYVCRNLSLARCETMAEEEREAFDRCVDILNDPAIKPGDTLEVFHTGLEPLVVGFYRGIVAGVYHYKKVGKEFPLTIRPRLFNVKGTREDLTPESPGARPENYLAGPDWR